MLGLGLGSCISIISYYDCILVFVALIRILSELVNLYLWVGVWY